MGAPERQGHKTARLVRSAGRPGSREPLLSAAACPTGLCRTSPTMHAETDWQFGPPGPLSAEQFQTACVSATTVWDVLDDHARRE